jgi:hypothetical protein
VTDAGTGSFDGNPFVILGNAWGERKGARPFGTLPPFPKAGRVRVSNHDPTEQNNFEKDYLFKTVSLALTDCFSMLSKVSTPSVMNARMASDREENAPSLTASVSRWC